MLFTNYQGSSRFLQEDFQDFPILLYINLDSGQEDGQPHMYMYGVGLMMIPDVTQSLLSWTPVCPRILTARCNSKARNVTIIQCYAPTNIAHPNDKEEFYDQFQAIIDNVPKRDIKILMGDLNAKVGTNNLD